MDFARKTPASTYYFFYAGIILSLQPLFCPPIYIFLSSHYFIYPVIINSCLSSRYYFGEQCDCWRFWRMFDGQKHGLHYVYQRLQGTKSALVLIIFICGFQSINLTSMNPMLNHYQFIHHFVYLIYYISKNKY